ncbi:nucleotide-binding universal stress UspA family protein [Maribacter caenipelagi]|uniref:Nucleotide-binding universal stress UspA family protein n=1 Tax=Maribacter caenipelagi TaxID=1447781 RepID=A0A4R7D8X6_9FLAO|nr:universal stress protein [Maribacter caenipelagi]TDS16852.1 nucleotide-binding universal stress UspA family protein [Maribacter caenipelagi]
MKTIVYATDYSKNSVEALKYAHYLNAKLGTRLVILHVFDYPTVLGTKALSEPFPNLEKDNFKMHHEKLEKFCIEHLGNDWNTSNIQLEIKENKSVIKGIFSSAAEWHADLILVGMKGGSGLREVIVGSTTKQLIEKAPCPVLAIPTKVGYRQIETIVYATDFEEEDIRTIKQLVEIAEPLQAKIHITHISTQDEYKGDMQMEWFKDALKEKVSYKNMIFKLVLSDDIFYALRIYLGDVGADLVVMLEREKKGFTKKMFHKDLVKKMESYGKIPLLSFNEHNHQTLYY